MEPHEPNLKRAASEYQPASWLRGLLAQSTFWNPPAVLLLLPVLLGLILAILFPLLRHFF